MKQIKINLSNMNCKKINKEYRKLITSTFSLGVQKSNRFEFGIIYTLYSDKFNQIELGFAETSKVLNNKLSKNKLTLLDKKRGKKKDLNLLINTLNEFGIKSLEDYNFRFSNLLMKHLSTLGWPIGNSLYKQKKIKKELSCA